MIEAMWIRKSQLASLAGCVRRYGKVHKTAAAPAL
jgi:hypothetical protein